MNDVRTTRRWLLTGFSLLMLLLLAAACASPGAGRAAGADETAPTPTAAAEAPAMEAEAVPTADAAEAANEAPKSGMEAQSNRYLTIYTSPEGVSQLLALDMKADGTFELTTDPHTDAPTVVESGVWTEDASGLITATLTRQNGRAYFAPLAVTLQREDDRLIVTTSAKELTNAVGLEFVPAAEVSERAQTGLFTIDLAAGFPLDPTFLSVNGGGEVDASILGEGCTGFINVSPVVTVNWTGETEQVRVFFVSDSDSTLVVVTPDGKILCNDDVSDVLLDPFLAVDSPAAGTYRIWVGSYAKSQLIPGVLVLSTRSDMGLGSFALADFIKRPKLAETAVEPVRKAISETLASPVMALRAKLPALAPGQEPFRQQMTAQGETAAFEVDLGEQICNGYLPAAPDYVFDWSGQADVLRIWFEGDGDATLLVLTPDQTPLCSDDAQAGANVNPLVEVADPAEGQYSVYVGRVHLDRPITGELVITESSTVQPAVQEPAAPAQP